MLLQRGDDGGLDVEALVGVREGLAAGEEVISVDGTPASQLALYDLIERLRGPVGSKFTLVVRGRAGVRTVTLTLADQV